MINNATKNLSDACLYYSKVFYDPKVNLIFNPPGTESAIAKPSGLHLIPNSVWYAYSLLSSERREGKYNSETIITVRKIIEAVIDLQYKDPDKIWNGTFRRFYEWSESLPDAAIEWKDYDPNWRQFVGIGFMLIIEEFSTVLDDDLIEKMMTSAIYAADSEPIGRIPDDYTNPKLMQFALKQWSLYKRGLNYTEYKLSNIIDNSGMLAEFNSPTYDGISVFALSMIAEYSPNKEDRDYANIVRNNIWQQVLIMYNKDMDNIVGPYTRAYYANMRDYVSLLSLWLWGKTGVRSGPQFEQPPFVTRHGHDAMMGCVIADLCDKWQYNHHVTDNNFNNIIALYNREFFINKNDNWMLGVETTTIVKPWIGYQQRVPMILHSFMNNGDVAIMYSRSGDWSIVDSSENRIILSVKNCESIFIQPLLLKDDLKFKDINVNITVPTNEYINYSYNKNEVICSSSNGNFNIIIDILDK